MLVRAVAVFMEISPTIVRNAKAACGPIRMDLRLYRRRASEFPSQGRGRGIVPKFIVDLWLDGYNTEEEMTEACAEFIYEQLNFSASSVKVELFTGQDEE